MSLSRRIELIEKKASRVEKEVTTHDFEVKSHEIESSFKKAISEVMMKLRKISKMKKNLDRKEEKQERQRLRKQLNIKLDKINQLLKKEIEDHFYLVNMAENQQNLTEYKLATKFIDEIAEQYHIDSRPLVVFKDRYLAYNSASLNKVSKSVLVSPYFEKQNYAYYPMLIHELGHTFTFENKSKIFSKFDDEMAAIKEDLEDKVFKDPRRGQEMEDFMFYWDNWKHEFAADLFAAEVLGSAYYKTLFYFLNGDPYKISSTHPPNAMRLKAVAKYCGINKDQDLEELLEDFDKDSEYGSLESEDLVDAISDAVNELTSDNPSNANMSVIHAEDAIDNPEKECEIKDIVPVMKAGWELLEDDHPLESINLSIQQTLSS